MEGAGLKPLQLAKATKKTSGAVTQWLTGQTKSLKAETANALEKATGYSANWLITGNGEKLLPAIGIANIISPPGSSSASGGPSVATGAVEMSLTALVVELGARLHGTDLITRAQSTPILVQLSKTPELAAELGARLEATIAMGTKAPFVPVNPFPKK